MKAVKCPVCEGSGKYEKKECHGCAGKGWVTVGMDYPIYPIYPQPYDPYPNPYPYDPYGWYTTISWDDHTFPLTGTGE